MHEQIGILLVLGISAFLGILGATLFQKIKVPQVVGYIVIGLLIGETGFGIVSSDHIESLQPLVYFALGMIGLLVGGELKLSEFRKYGKQFASILLGEGLTAFFIVGVLSGLVFYKLTGSATIATAAGVVLGAIASATDPASTISVLWEYRSKGILTTALIAVVALDDALAMTLYSIGKSVATMIAGGDVSAVHELLSVVINLGGSLLIGTIAGFVLNRLVRNIHEKENALAFSVCTLFLVVGLCVSLDLDVILASMTMGFVITNLAPRRSENLFRMARGMSIPIYVLFFVLVGARLNMRVIPAWVWGVAAIYVLGRSGGKFFGTWLGAKQSKAAPVIQKYCGLGLFAQGGVAIGLSVVAGHSLQGIQVNETMNLGEAIVAIVTSTTLIVQVIGPPMTKLAVKLSGEMGRNITEEDVAIKYAVKDSMGASPIFIKENDTLEVVVNTFAESGLTIHPVLNLSGDLVGVISFNALREALPDRESWQWLLATDVMSAPCETVTPDTSLQDTLHIMRSTNSEVLLVSAASDSNDSAGIIERSRIQSFIRQKMLTEG